MIKIICGMLGSGKTTFAKNNKKSRDILLDWDLIREAFQTDDFVYIKPIQDYLLQFYNDKGYDIWYITTYLGSNEKEMLKNIKDVEYLWINTTKRQCLENIKKRNRGEETKHLENIDNINKRIQEQYTNESEIKYKIINVFESNERW